MTIKAKKESEEIKTVVKAEEMEEETEKAQHSEPDADNMGGESDNDEDNKKKAKKEDEEEDTEKGEVSGINPEEDANASAQAGSTTSPNAGVPSTQDVFVPQSRIAGSRMATTGSLAGGQSPSEVRYTGKSGNADLMKSPLYVGMSKQLGEFQKAMSDKFEAIEKSFSDRIANLDKALKALEEMPMRKGFNDTITAQEVAKAEKTFRYTN